MDFLNSVRLFIKISLITLNGMSLMSCAVHHQKEERTSSIKPITHFQQIGQDVTADKNTLVLIDIDGTILTTQSPHYGSDDYFVHILKEEIARTNCTEAQGVLKVYGRWAKAQPIIATKLVDPNIHQFLKEVRNQEATVIAFTARQPMVADITFKQLQQHDITLDSLKNMTFNPTYRNQISPDAKWCAANEKNEKQCATKPIIHYDSQALFDRGTLFSHSLNTKGKVFKDFYEHITLFRESNGLPPITRIIFIDDKAHNLSSLDAATQEIGLDFYGYHFQYKINFDPAQALRAEKQAA